MTDSDKSMIDFILDIDWMTTVEFCRNYNVPIPTVQGGAASFLAVDAIKHKMFVDHAKQLRKQELILKKSQEKS